MEIDGRKIGPDHPPYIIAEMSNNHLGHLDRARDIIEAARDAGADAVKIQTFDPDALTIDCSKPDFVIKSPLWKGKTYYQLYSEIALPLEYTADLFACARRAGITLFSSPFDVKTVDLLVEQDCPAFKVASFEAVDPGFLLHVASTGKPVLMSTGVSSLADIETALHVLEKNGAGPVLLFHCVSRYPASHDSFNLRALHVLQKFSPFVGLSDHCPDNTAALAAVAMGACAVEKHLTLSRRDGGPDAAFSIEPDQMKQLKKDSVKVWESLGSDKVFEKKRAGFEHARSLYIVKDVKKGESLTAENIRSIRPGYGLVPVCYDRVIGRRFNNDFDAGTALKWEYLS